MFNDTYPRCPEIVTNERTIIHLDKIGLLGIREVVRVRFVKSDIPIRQHTHPDAIELSYVARGHQIYCIGDEDYCLTGGDVFVAHANELHHSKKHRQECGVLLYYMIIDVTNFHEAFLGLSCEDALSMEAAMKSLPYKFHLGMEYTTRLEELFTLYLNQPACWQTTLRCKFILLLMDIINSARNTAYAQYRTPEISRTLEYIETHLYSRDFTSTRMLANEVYLSEPQFINRFKNEMGTTPQKYILKRKMDKASQMLLDGIPIISISMELGFASSQHFSNTFRSYYGMPPSMWLKANLAE